MVLYTHLRHLRLPASGPWPFGTGRTAFLHQHLRRQWTTKLLLYLVPRRVAEWPSSCNMWRRHFLSQRSCKKPVLRQLVHTRRNDFEMLIYKNQRTRLQFTNLELLGQIWIESVMHGYELLDHRFQILSWTSCQFNNEGICSQTGLGLTTLWIKVRRCGQKTSPL